MHHVPSVRLVPFLVGLALTPAPLFAQSETEEPEPTPEICLSACCYGHTGGGGPPVCNIFNFLSFQDAWIAGETCAINMDTSTGIDVGDVFDFLAFQREFISGIFVGC